MSTAEAVEAPGAAPLRSSIALAADAVRAIRWPHIRNAMLFGLAVSLADAMTFIGSLRTFLAMHGFIVGGVIADQIRALCLLVAIVIADRVVDAGGPRRSAYLAAALGGCVLGVLLSEPFSVAWRTWVLPEQWGGAGKPWLRGTAAYFYHPIFQLTHWLLIGGSAVFLYADRRAARQTEARLRAAELDRVHRSRLALESRLQAMQARIEPQFLFNTLAQVERLYETDPALGARMLDDLIVYLRAAMPLMRDTSSTVAQEIELARAYLGIVRLRLGERLQVDIEAPAGAERMRMPPMMLLPLIDHAVVHGLEPATGSGAIRLRIEPADGRLRVTVFDSGAGFAPDCGSDGIAAIRERLAALYGGDARLELRRAADARATEAVLDLPLEARGSAAELQPAPAQGAAA